MKAGAIQFKGAVYILPDNEENLEFYQWLISEVTSMRGEGAFVKVKHVETLRDSEIISLFNQQREKDYRIIEKGLEELERKINSIKKGTGIKSNKNILENLNKFLKEIGAIKKIDFFSSKMGYAIEKRIRTLENEVKSISGVDIKKQSAMVMQKNIEDYQRKTWVTRKRPFVDRMASAWLIKKFIDEYAVFKFINEQDVEDLDKKTIAFDVRGGEFTHIVDMCTFEVIIRVFGLKNKTLKKLAEIVHELDMKDEKYKNPETTGIEEILIGIRRTATDDKEAIERGMDIFEMLYRSKT